MRTDFTERIEYLLHKYDVQRNFAGLYTGENAFVEEYAAEMYL